MKTGTSDVAAGDETATLRQRVEKLAKINAALMQRVERAMDHQANAFSMFQTAISLEAKVRARTEELKSALHHLERTNNELTTARDAAERANRFKTRFFTSVGHDLLQPLHAARLSLSAMETERRQGHDRRLLDQIDHALSTIEELLRTILDLSKLEAGGITPALQSIDLGELFQSVVVDLEPIARNKKLMLTVRAAPVLVLTDALMLRRILQNLLANAVRYTEHGRVLLAARRRADTVRIEVWDTGPGIPEAERERIFEEFQRGSASERGPGGGFGIGLSITRRMADTLGSEIELCSRPGNGTRFSLCVPYAGPVAQLPAAPVRRAQEVYGFTGSKAVVIDNECAVIDSMRPLLAGWGFETRFIYGMAGIEALLNREPEFCPDIILADYHLDFDESGLRAIRQLRDNCQMAIPAIVITADYSPEITDVVSAAGCEILRKPVKPAELRALMMHVLSRAVTSPG